MMFEVTYTAQEAASPQEQRHVVDEALAMCEGTLSPKVK